MVRDRGQEVKPKFWREGKAKLVFMSNIVSRMPTCMVKAMGKMQLILKAGVKGQC